ncbi:MAG: tetratricopeptide repeat protein [Gemmatimonadaceae bacterium]|nr:tetratricopeptide repeat protein [Gemmatimonadaceae bacterium]
MTSPNFAPRAAGGAEDTFTDWLTTNWRTVAIIAGVVAAAGTGYWLFERQQSLKESRAERALLSAQAAVAAGNGTKSIEELQKVASRYPGTNAGTMSALLMAQQSYADGKPEDGLKALQAAAGSAPSHLKASIEAMIGAGLSQQGKEADAAARYEKAAALTSGTDRELYLADAARAYSAAGKKAEAVKLWRQLAEREGSSRSVEARIRLGELEAKVQQ